MRDSRRCPADRRIGKPRTVCSRTQAGHGIQLGSRNSSASRSRDMELYIRMNLHNETQAFNQKIQWQSLGDNPKTCVNLPQALAVP